MGNQAKAVKTIDKAVEAVCVGGALAAIACLTLFGVYRPIIIDHRLDARRAAQVRAWTAPPVVYLCEEWFCDGAVALPETCESQGGTLRHTGAWIGVTDDTFTLGLRRPGMMSFRLCDEPEVRP